MKRKILIGFALLTTLGMSSAFAGVTANEVGPGLKTTGHTSVDFASGATRQIYNRSGYTLQFTPSLQSNVKLLNGGSEYTFNQAKASQGQESLLNVVSVGIGGPAPTNCSFQFVRVGPNTTEISAVSLNRRGGGLPPCSLSGNGDLVIGINS